MKTILLIGATGQISTLLLPHLFNAEYQVVALARKPGGFQHPSIKWLQGDLEGDFGFAFEGCDTVIFCAGSGAASGFDKTLLVDLWAAKRAVDYALSYKIKHFVMLSSRGAFEPDNGPERIKPYLVAKHFADRYLEQSGVNYTILEPGRLLDEAPCKLYQTQRPLDSSEQIISRADVALAIAACVDTRQCVNKRFELFRGEHEIEKIIAEL